MSYTSKVRFSTTHKGWSNVKGKLPFPAEIVEEYPNGIVFGWDGIGWFEGAGDYADDIGELVHEETKEKGEPYENLIVGEELDDVKWFNSWWQTTKPDIPHLDVELMNPDGDDYDKYNKIRVKA